MEIDVTQDYDLRAVRNVWWKRAKPVTIGRRFQYRRYWCARLACARGPARQYQQHDLLGLPKLSSMARVRQLRFLEKTVYIPPTRLTRQIIGCQAKRPNGHRFTRGSVTTTQTSYRDALIEAGLCEKGDSGALCKWMVNFKKSDASDTIDTNLGLPPGTYRRGRHRGTRATRNSNVRI